MALPLIAAAAAPAAGSFISSAGGAALISGVAGLAGGLGKALLGKPNTERLEKFMDFLMKQLNQGGISDEEQEALFQRLRRSNSATANRFGNSVGRRLDLDSGVAQGEIANFGLQLESNQRFGIARDSYNQRHTQKQNFIGQLTSANLGLVNA